MGKWHKCQHNCPKYQLKCHKSLDKETDMVIKTVMERTTTKMARTRTRTDMEKIMVEKITIKTAKTRTTTKTAKIMARITTKMEKITTRTMTKTAKIVAKITTRMARTTIKIMTKTTMA